MKYIDKFDISKEVIVPIKLPELPYILKHNIKTASLDNNKKFILNSNVKVKKMSSVDGTRSKKPIGHKISGAQYYEEPPVNKYNIIAIDNINDTGEGVASNDSNSTNVGNESAYNDTGGTLDQASDKRNESELYGVCEIVKFNNQIKTTDKKDVLVIYIIK